MSLKNRIRLFRTIGFKITLWYSLSVIIIFVFLGAFLYFSLQYKLLKRSDLLILDEAEEFLQLILDENPAIKDLETIMEQKFSGDRYYNLSAKLLNVKKDTVITSKDFIVQNMEISEELITKAKEGYGIFETVRVEGRKYPYRLLTKTIYHGDSLKYILQVGLYLKPVYKTVENIEENLIMLIPVFVIFSITGGWFFARKNLTPIENITETARKITTSNLNKRLVPTHTGDELDELIETINLMLERIENSFNKITQFTSDVSHELRTPVACLKIGTEVILSKERTAEEYRELHENNLRKLEEITRMINDLLILLKSDSGIKRLHVKSFNLGNTLKELQDTFMMIAETKKIYLSMDEIPDIQISGDETLLRRAFLNLLDNAIKYTSPGGCINVSLEDREDEVIVRIEDTGIGISEGHLEKIFDRFFRVDPSRSRESGGTGLGLNICKNIVELHKGKIEVKSKLGAGSTFEVTLPNLVEPEPKKGIVF